MLPCVLVVIPGFGGICVILATHPQPPVSHLDRRGPPSGPLPPQLRVWKCSDFLEKLGSGCHTTGHRQPWPPLPAFFIQPKAAPLCPLVVHLHMSSKPMEGTPSPPSPRLRAPAPAILVLAVVGVLLNTLPLGVLARVPEDGVSVLCLPPPVFRALVNQEFSWTPLCHHAWLLSSSLRAPGHPTPLS